MTAGSRVDQQQIREAAAEKRCSRPRTPLATAEQLATSWHQQLRRRRRVTSQPR